MSDAIPTTADHADFPTMGRSLTLSMAVAAGLAAANIYYNQPMLGIMQHDMPGPTTGFIATATQLGYAAGLFLLVPLGDLLERRRLIVAQFLLLALALAATAMAPGAIWVIAASLVVGAASTAAQQIVPLAAHLAAPERRGATVGTVMAGLLCGILLSRTIAGFVGSHAGWRGMFWLGVPVALGVAAWMAVRLPHSPPPVTTLRYGTLMRSLGGLWREFAELRLAALTQALLFASFSLFWTVLAWHLQSPRYNLGSEVAGLFGVVGAVGILAAPLAGRVADKHGPHRVIVVGAALSLVSWGVFYLWNSLAGLVVGVVALDFAVQSALVSNQHIVYALRPEARARINTIFMGTMFLGGSAGSAAASTAWHMGGWTMVSILGVVVSILATAMQMRSLRHR